MKRSLYEHNEANGGSGTRRSKKQKRVGNGRGSSSPQPSAVGTAVGSGGGGNTRDDDLFYAEYASSTALYRLLQLRQKKTPFFLPRTLSYRAPYRRDNVEVGATKSESTLRAQRGTATVGSPTLRYIYRRELSGHVATKALPPLNEPSTGGSTNTTRGASSAGAGMGTAASGRSHAAHASSTSTAVSVNGAGDIDNVMKSKTDNTERGGKRRTIRVGTTGYGQSRAAALRRFADAALRCKSAGGDDNADADTGVAGGSIRKGPPSAVLMKSNSSGTRSLSDSFVAVHYRFSRGFRERVEVLDTPSCPWCGVFCGDPVALLCHMCASHDRFQFDLDYDRERGGLVQLERMERKGLEDGTKTVAAAEEATEPLCHIYVQARAPKQQLRLDSEEVGNVMPLPLSTHLVSCANGHEGKGKRDDKQGKEKEEEEEVSANTSANASAATASSNEAKRAGFTEFWFSSAYERQRGRPSPYARRAILFSGSAGVSIANGSGTNGLIDSGSCIGGANGDGAENSSSMNGDASAPSMATMSTRKGKRHAIARRIAAAKALLNAVGAGGQGGEWGRDCVRQRRANGAGVQHERNGKLERQYYHSTTMQPIDEHELDHDSDDDCDEEWRLSHSERVRLSFANYRPVFRNSSSLFCPARLRFALLYSTLRRFHHCGNTQHWESHSTHITTS